MDENTKKVKRKPNLPRCIFNGRSYVIVRHAANTLCLEADGQRIFVHKDAVRPTNKEGRELVNGL